MTSVMTFYSPLVIDQYGRKLISFEWFIILAATSVIIVGRNNAIWIFVDFNHIFVCATTLNIAWE